MPRPPASQMKAVVQKFAVVQHIHYGPKCSKKKHHGSCRAHGYWIGCTTIDRRRGRTKEGGAVYIDDPRCVCTHLKIGT